MAIAARYKGYRYPIEVIGHAVWLYHRFALSLRDVEELMLARGVAVTHETIRSWCAKFGPDYAARLRRRRPRPGDKWHFDEVFVTINGTTHYLWRAVDQHGTVLDILVQSRRKRGGGHAVFPQAAQGPAIRAAGDCHRQAGQLSGRCPRGLPSVTHRRSKYLNSTDPTCKLRITIDYEDEVGYQWRRTDTSQPRRTDDAPQRGTGTELWWRLD